MVNFENLLATLQYEIRPFGQASDRASDTFGHCSVFSFSWKSQKNGANKNGRKTPKVTPSFRARNKVITGITMRTTFSMNRPSDPCRHTFGQLRILQPIPICWKSDLRQMGKLLIIKLQIWEASLSHPPGREREASPTG